MYTCKILRYFQEEYVRNTPYAYCHCACSAQTMNRTAEKLKQLSDYWLRFFSLVLDVGVKILFVYWWIRKSHVFRMITRRCISIADWHQFHYSNDNQNQDYANMTPFPPPALSWNIFSEHMRKLCRKQSSKIPNPSVISYPVLYWKQAMWVGMGLIDEKKHCYC